MPDGKATHLWLQTSPEFGMKRLLASGATAIYQITRAFRGAERGPLHNPEFTMVEWYRVGDDMQQGMQLLDELAQATLGRGAAERLSYAAAFRRAIGLDPLQMHRRGVGRRARRHGLQADVPWDPADRDAWLDWLLVTCVEPTLGRGRPTILYDYPASQAALAVVRPDTTPVAERFELYVDGIELANGYHELTDAAVLRERTRVANQAPPCGRQVHVARDEPAAGCHGPRPPGLHRRRPGLRSVGHGRPGSQGPPRSHGLPHRPRAVLNAEA